MQRTNPFEDKQTMNQVQLFASRLAQMGEDIDDAVTSERVPATSAEFYSYTAELQEGIALLLKTAYQLEQYELQEAALKDKLGVL